ncbi:unnamed protein product [Parnassius apollo]|uniref:(apollo) hypothetical protein n=1 Tax=Parnassius apollo TaxID=110799 RepID=A0A8S3WSN9_PARAO|nr:unnamed protein product [Parnassius apollo]
MESNLNIQSFIRDAYTERYKSDFSSYYFCYTGISLPSDDDDEAYVLLEKDPPAEPKNYYWDLDYACSFDCDYDVMVPGVVYINDVDDGDSDMELDDDQPQCESEDITTPEQLDEDSSLAADEERTRNGEHLELPYSSGGIKRSARDLLMTQEGLESPAQSTDKGLKWSRHDPLLDQEGLKSSAHFSGVDNELPPIAVPVHDSPKRMAHQLTPTSRIRAIFKNTRIFENWICDGTDLLPVLNMRVKRWRSWCEKHTGLYLRSLKGTWCRHSSTASAT